MGIGSLLKILDTSVFAWAMEARWRTQVRQLGWGLVLSADAPAEVESALEPLLVRRRAQTESRFKIFSGSEGLQPGESAREFLARHRASPQAPQGDPVPGLLLLVGGPDAVSFRVQSELAAGRGVGRLAFDRIDDYARYASNVARHENERQTVKPSVTVVAPTHQSDAGATRWSGELIAHVQRKLALRPRLGLSTLIGADATKARISGALTSPGSAKVVFVVAHGVEVARGAPEQRVMQGALVCSDWPGPSDRPSPLALGHVFGTEDLHDGTDLWGRIVVAAGSFTAGTPTTDAFALYALGRVELLAPQAFVASLASRALGLERGAVAWVGHADRVWAHARVEGQGAPVADAYAEFLQRLLAGEPIGIAARVFESRAAAMSVRLEELGDELAIREGVGTREFAEAWTAQRDLSSLVVLGDPAVRVSLLVAASPTPGSEGS